MLGQVPWLNGQKFLTITVAKISKLLWSNGRNWSYLTMTMAKISKLPWSHCQSRSILTIDHRQFPGCHGHGQIFLPWGKFQGVMVKI